MIEHSIREQIRSSVTMQMAVDMYLNDLPKNRRIPCPFHNGHDYNCAIYTDTLHCYVCNESFDVFDLVMRLFGLSFPDAMVKLNADFGLGLPIGRKPTDAERTVLETRYNERMAERERERAEKEKSDREWLQLVTDIVNAERAVRDYAPKCPDEQPDPRWVEAVSALNELKYRYATETYN